ncbi:MAG: hypothetical protein KatS3mg095_1013 [Candidatus Parcubacteria bacterium]|nr:MAG: hypothetical protein KatS3mg095_1013 [Candidatus Parcubacteria bacterium]
MKKILFIGDNWFGDLGGRKKIVLSVINYLSDKYKIFLLTIDTKIKKSEIKNINQDLSENVRIKPYFFKRNPLFYFKLFFLFGKEIFKIKPDLVICFGGGPHSNAFFFFIAKFFYPFSKTIFIEQGNTRFLYNKQNKFIKKLTAYAFKKVDLIISASREAAEDVGYLFGNKRVNFVYNFIDIEKIDILKEEKVEESVFNRRKQIILSVARLDLNQKDFSTLIKAFQIISKRFDAYLVIIGDGPDRNKIEKLVKDLKLEDKIFLMGHKTNPYKYMKNSTIFVLSSFHEGMPIVLIEALVCGIPVIATDCNFGPREVLENGEYGILVPVGNYEKMAEAIEKLLTDKEFSNLLISRGRQRILSFTKDKSLKKYENIVEDLLTKK